jgi:hypothetical protein
MPSSLAYNSSILRWLRGEATEAGVVTLKNADTLSTLVSLNASTGAITFDGNLTIDGNLDVNGTTTTVDTATMTVEDPLLELAVGNAADILDIGFYANYDDGTARFCGLFRDATDGTFKLFDTLTVEPTTTVDTGGVGYDHADLQVGGLTVDDASTFSGTADFDAGITLADAQSITGDGALTIATTGANDLTIDPSQDVYFDLADAVGARSVNVRDSGTNTVFSVNSDGDVDTSGAVVLGGLSLSINDDASAAVSESPSLYLYGGDGEAAPNDDIVQTRIVQDSVNELVEMRMLRSRDGGAYGHIAPV